jgi:hypothetical protein
MELRASVQLNFAMPFIVGVTKDFSGSAGDCFAITGLVVVVENHVLTSLIASYNLLSVRIITAVWMFLIVILVFIALSVRISGIDVAVDFASSEDLSPSLFGVLPADSEVHHFIQSWVWLDECSEPDEVSVQLPETRLVLHIEGVEATVEIINALSFCEFTNLVPIGDSVLGVAL